MILSIENHELDELADRLAVVRGVDKTQAVREALENELDRARSWQVKREELRKLQDSVEAMTGPNPRPVDKAWIDSFYEDD